MNLDKFKKLIKDCVRESIQEELKDILLEALRTPKPMLENNIVRSKGDINVQTDTSKREHYVNILNSMMQGQELPPVNQNSNLNENYEYRPSGGSTAAEGSTLPPGEVPLNQLFSLMGKN